MGNKRLGDIVTDTMVLLLVLALLVLSLMVLVPGLIEKYNNYKFPPERVNSSQNVLLVETVDDELTNLFNKNENEFAVCLYGTLEDDDIIITRVEQSEAIESSPEHIILKRCSKTNELIGQLHSHPNPNGVCRQSALDIYSFGAAGTLLDGVMCGPNQYGFFVKNSYNQQPTEGLNYGVI